jgi:hypothetical protein
MGSLVQTSPPVLHDMYDSPIEASMLINQVSLTRHNPGCGTFEDRMLNERSGPTL